MNAPTSDLHLAVLRFEQRRYEESNQLLLSCKPTANEESFTYFCVGRNHLSACETAQAQAWFERSLQTSPTFRWTHYELSRLLDAADDMRGACQQMTRFIGIYTDQSLVSELNQTHLQEIIRVAHRVFEHCRNDAVLLYNFAYALGVRDYLTELRIIESQLDAARVVDAVTGMNKLTELHTLDAWGLLVLSRIQFAQDKVTLALETISAAIEIDTTNYMIRTTAAHALLSFKLFDEAKSYYKYVLRGLSKQNASVEQEIYGIQFRLAVLQRDHSWLLVHCRIPGFLDRIPNWLCVEGLFNFALPGFLSTKPDLDVATELESFLEAQQTYTLGTILSLLQSYSHKRLWPKVLSLQKKIKDDPLFEHHEVVLRRFECLCSSLKMTEAKEFYYKYYFNKHLRHWETCVVLRFLVEAKMWILTEKLLVHFFECGYILPDGNFFLLKLCRRFSKHRDVINLIDAIPEPNMPSQYNQLRVLLTDDLAIRNNSIVLHSALINNEIVLSEKNAIFQKNLFSGDCTCSTVAGYLCSDKAYFFSVLTFFASFATHKSSTIKMDWFVFLASDVPDDWIPIIDSFTSKIGLRIKTIKSAEFVQGNVVHSEKYGIFTGGNILSSAAFLRIYAAMYIHKLGKFERAVYFDSDVVCNQDISPLLLVPFNGMHLLARLEEPSPEIEQVTKQHHLVQKSYFNSGVLAFNLTCKDCSLYIAEAIRIAEDSTMCLVFHDQCALNIAFAGKVDFLEPRFNFFLRSNRIDNGNVDSALVLHFLDQPKPWDLAYERSYRAIWWRYAGLVRVLLSSSDYNNIVAAAN